MITKTYKYISISLIVLALGLSGFFILRTARYHYHFRFSREISLNFIQLSRSLGGLNILNERILGMICEADDEDWDKVLELCAENEHKNEICSYYYNLANAMQGKLADRLMYYYQPFERALIPTIGEESSKLKIIASSDVWYQLGAMTMAEHNTMIGMIFSPEHKGPLFFRKLAKINLINGEVAVAEKYLRLLGKKIPEDSWIHKRSLLPKSDKVLLTRHIKETLRALVEANPQNIPAYEYLLCYDLMMKDLASFMKDYVPGRKESRLFEEAALIWMASRNELDDKILDDFNISKQTFDEFNEYTEIYLQDKGKNTRLKDKYSKTYWYFYHYAKRNE